MNYNKIINIEYIPYFNNDLFGLIIQTFINLYGDVIEECYVFKGKIIYKTMYIIE